MEAPEQAEALPAPPKKKSKVLVVALVTAALVVSAAVAGIVLGPRIAAARAQTAEKKPPAEPAIGETVPFEPVIVDTRSEDSAIHHIKVGIALELKEGVVKEEALKYMPRGREAAVSYLRGQPFEVVGSPERFEEIRKELGHRVTEAFGEKHVERVLVTDFVAQ